jgi:SAM-dependent methyltransferase
VAYTDAGAIFSGTAAYYRYRPALPATVVEFVLERAERVGASVLDLGCGPGTFAIPLAARGLDVVAVDANAEMLAVGRAGAAQAGVPEIRWLRARAEDLADQVAGDRVGAVVISDAFHYLNSVTVLAQLSRVVEPGGLVAVVCSRAAGAARPWWYPIVERLVDKYAGPQRLAGAGQPYRQPAHDHESVLRASPFHNIELLTVDYTIDVHVDRMVIAQLSYAFSSPAVLSNRQAAFTEDLREALLAGLPHHLPPRCTARTQACVILGRRNE